MSHFTISLAIVGAFVLILGTIMAIRTYLKNRREEVAPFRNYFGAEYSRDLLRQSSWCDDEKLYDRQNRIDAVGIRNRRVNEHYLRDTGSTWGNCDRD
jgi:hypothetical protein